MKKAGRRPSTISTASWRRELSDPQAVFRALVTPTTLPLAPRSRGKDSRDDRDWWPREPLPGPLGQREEVDR